jgi:predicted transcriptional regulator
MVSIRDPYQIQQSLFLNDVFFLIDDDIVGHDMPPPIACTQFSTFGETFDKLIQKRARRTWIVDDQINLIGVVSLKDIVNTILDRCEMQG